MQTPFDFDPCDGSCMHNQSHLSEYRTINEVPESRVQDRAQADQNYNCLFCAKLFGFSNVKIFFTFSEKVARSSKPEGLQPA